VSRTNCKTSYWGGGKKQRKENIWRKKMQLGEEAAGSLEIFTPGGLLLTSHKYNSANSVM
jgi:hypothetical protein